MRQRLARLGRRQDGFTLIELIVVVAILGILAVVLTPRVLDAVENARVNAALSSAKQIQLGLERYMLEDENSGGKYPEQLVADDLKKYVAIDADSLTIDEYSATDSELKDYTLRVTFSKGDIKVMITPDSVTKEDE